MVTILIKSFLSKSLDIQKLSVYLGIIKNENKETMTNEQKIQAEFEALINEGKAEAKLIVEKAAQEARKSPRPIIKKPKIVKYTIEDVTPAGYGI